MIILFSAKCSDTFGISVYDKNGKWVADGSSRVPDFLGVWGDYIRLEIDMETGKVENFEQMKKEFQEWLEEEQAKQQDKELN